MIERNYTPEDLGRRLKELLNEKNISQRKFANELGVNEGYISHIIKGERALILTNLCKACEILATTPNYLIYGIK